MLPEFIETQSDKPVLFECFTDVDSEREAWSMRLSIDTYEPSRRPTTLKDEVKKLVPQRVKSAIKELIK